MPAPNYSPTASFGLLLVRIVTGALLIYGHGWPKLMSFSERAAHFPDPLHIGPDRSLVLTIFAEAVCAFCVAIGFATRFAAAAIVMLFAVILLVVQRGELFGELELALLYGAVYLCLVFTGAGTYALDARYGPKVKFGGGK
ncbi:MAG: DoxX family protein [Candidatus Eisenbacteria bacterium]